MISLKKLLKMARKWKKFATLQKKRIAFPRKNQDSNINSCTYLQTDLFRQLLMMSEDEFGLPSDRPIKLPCDTICMIYIISLIQKGISGDVQKALLTSVADIRCSSSSSYHRDFNQPLLVY
ncbi:hypothetical protein CDL12_01523 [Handroanthus impetiginosus]|uniref:Uncharacterized protein n=1 Tax=Handroanthus impetiginosus TaxID=429701 RepID=A0A2G9I7K1_9LAMI|nr:hypothetical protein CDL12_01523 [Handroanthus impetiginosus]